MEILEFEVMNILAQVKKEVTYIKVLNAGDPLKAEIGVDAELDKVVPQGKKWDVVFNVRLVETDI